MMISWNIGQDSWNEELSMLGTEHFNTFLNGRKIEEIEFNEWFNFLVKEKKLIDSDDTHTQTANNNFFRKGVNSFIPTLVKNLLDQRSLFKKQLAKCEPGTAEYGDLKGKQSVVKEMANSMFGITADKKSRYFNEHIAEAITMTGQLMNKTTAAIFDSLNEPAIYGDTDSIFVHVNDGTDVETLQKEVNDKLTEFLYKWFSLQKSIVYLEYDKAYRKMILLDKKRYTGMMKYLNDQEVNVMYSKGTEDVKKNTIGIAKQKFIELVKLITDEDKSLEEVREWIETLRSYVMTTSDLAAADLEIKTSVSKPTYKYKSKPVHVRLAEKLIKEGKLLEAVEAKNSWGNQISYIIIDNEDKGENGAILSQEFNGEWDRKYYWDVQIFAPLERILSVVWPEVDWEIYDYEKAAKKERKKKLEEKKAAQAIEKEEKAAKKKKKQQSLEI
jgi:DNA polymerase elongation subunit (family B)